MIGVLYRLAAWTMPLAHRPAARAAITGFELCGRTPAERRWQVLQTSLTNRNRRAVNSLKAS